MSPEPVWRVAVDTGGTFTDCLAIDPGGRRHRAKFLSSGDLRASVAVGSSGTRLELDTRSRFPDDFFRGWLIDAPGVEAIEVNGSQGRLLELAASWPGSDRGGEVRLRSTEEAAVVAARWVTGTAAGDRMPPTDLRLATTRGTNALLERQGARVALFVTRGFGDLLAIGNQQRPELFALDIRKAPPLWSATVEVDERLDDSGSVVQPLNESALEHRARELVAQGFRTAAVAFLHSYREPGHERAAARVLERVGFEHVSCSSSLAGRIKIVPRAQTAVVDAYLSDKLARYLGSVESRARPRNLHVMTSAGGLTSVAAYRAKDSLLSGPAAGVVGAAAAGRRSGFDRVIAFDMGGTSTDVSRVDGELEVHPETRVGSAHLLSPSVAVETVAAGGGSICAKRDDRVVVGPESAGADPGPACYGGGGPLTLTDVNLLLGRLVPSRFPFRVDRRAAEERLLEVGAAAGRPDSEAAGDLGVARNRDAFLAGFLAIANERMAGAIRAISVRRGYDPREYTLLAFGGAGGQHAIALAESLGMRRVLVPADGALLSAVGLSCAAMERWAERQVLAPLASAADQLGSLMAEMAEEAASALSRQGLERSGIESGPRTVFLRYQGQESTLPVAWADGASEEELRSDFEAAYGTLYGYLPSGPELEVESLRLSMRARTREPEADEQIASNGSGRASLSQELWDGSAWVQAPVFEKSALVVGESVRGPALVAERHTVTVAERNWTVRLDPRDALVLERLEEPER